MAGWKQGSAGSEKCSGCSVSGTSLTLCLFILLHERIFCFKVKYVAKLLKMPALKVAVFTGLLLINVSNTEILGEK